MFTNKMNLQNIVNAQILTLLILLLNAALPTQYVWGQALSVINSTGDTLMHVQDGGNVGIGTSSPTEKLDVNGDMILDDGDPQLTLFRNDPVFYHLKRTGTSVQLSSGGTLTLQSNVGFLQFRTGAMQLGRWANNGNLGIGEPNPGAKLEVVGDLMVSSVSSITNGNGDRFIVKTDGNVGIGTTSPAGVLEVIGTDGVKTLVARGNSTQNADILDLQNSGGVSLFTVNSQGRLLINSAGSASAVAVGINNSAGTGMFTSGNNLAFARDGTQVMTLTDGNVGIGTTSPFAKIQINNDDGTIPAQIIRGATSQSADIVQIIENPSSGAGAHFVSAGANNVKFQLRRTSDGSTMIELHPQGFSYFNGGNVGIGTTNPSAKLDVVGTTELNGSLDVDGGILHVDGTNDRVGIGTTGPFAKIQINNDDATIPAQIIRGATSQSADIVQIIENPSSAAGAHFVSAGANNVKFQLRRTSDGSTMVELHPQGFSYFNGGNVGIGTTTPTSRLHVVGNFTATGTKSFAQEHPTDPTKEIIYVALEGGEAGTYIRGKGELVDGKAVVHLPEHFSLVTNEEGLTVQLTPRGKWLRLYAVDVTTRQIVVKEAQGKSGQFDYLVQGVRKGYEGHRVIRGKQS